MSERFAAPQASAWEPVPMDEYQRLWSAFDARFAFRAGTTAEAWPAIREPTPSITFDLGQLHDGPQRGAAYDAINAEALRAFVFALPDVESLLVLDWQHPAYRFKPATQALSWRPEWPIPVYPDGDYYAFLTPDLAEGTFGHPWERTLCVFGDRLLDALGATLLTWLPVKRRDGK